MDFFEVATSTPTTRRFLDRPIADAELMKIPETANTAPSGSNTQPWEFIVVRDIQMSGRGRTDSSGERLAARAPLG